MTTLEWRIVPPEEVEDRRANRCQATRGPRSKIQCEDDVRTHYTDEYGHIHMARGVRGQWYTW